MNHKIQELENGIKHLQEMKNSKEVFMKKMQELEPILEIL